MNKKIGQKLLGLVGASVMAIGSVRAKSVPYMQTVPIATWQAIGKMPAVKTGGHSQVKIQIIFDANCPWCARLYQILHKNHPRIAISWIPVAYIKHDSYSLAKAILTSENPTSSLQKNFDQYDFQHHHGGYRYKYVAPIKMSSTQIDFQKQWISWGGYTPMVFVRVSGQKIVRVAGYDTKALEYLAKKIERSRPESGHTNTSITGD